MTVDEFSVDGGQPVVDHHVHPLPKHPELKVKDAGILLRVFGIPLLILVVRNDLRLLHEKKREEETNKQSVKTSLRFTMVAVNWCR